MLEPKLNCPYIDTQIEKLRLAYDNILELTKDTEISYEIQYELDKIKEVEHNFEEIRRRFVELRQWGASYANICGAKPKDLLDLPWY